MPDNRVTIVLDATGSEAVAKVFSDLAAKGQQFANSVNAGAKTAGSAFDALGNSAKRVFEIFTGVNLANILGSIATKISAIADEAAKLGMQALVAERAFHGMTAAMGVDADALLGKFTAVGKGLVDMSDIMLASSRGLQQGLNQSQLVALLTLATDRAKLAGTTVEQAFNQMSDAIATNSTRALRQFNIPAIIDLMVALRELPTIPEVRADRTLRFPQIPFTRGSAGPDNGSTDLIIPIYGRRMITVQVLSPYALSVTLSLVSLIQGTATIPRLLGTFVIPASIPAQVRAGISVIRASDAGRVGNFAAGTGEYSDGDIPGTPNGGIIASPRGMADLLLINLNDDSGAVPPAVTVFVDVFVKIADRET